LFNEQIIIDDCLILSKNVYRFKLGKKLTQKHQLWVPVHHLIIAINNETIVYQFEKVDMKTILSKNKYKTFNCSEEIKTSLIDNLLVTHFL